VPELHQAHPDRFRGSPQTAPPRDQPLSDPPTIITPNCIVCTDRAPRANSCRSNIDGLPVSCSRPSPQLLESYWRPWAANVRAAMAGNDPGKLLPDGVVPWAALGPGRLHATITTGEIISETAAADHTANVLEHGELLERVKARRLGHDGQLFTVADGYAARGLIDAGVNDAASMPGDQPAR
jgi:hypothetical protein